MHSTTRNAPNVHPRIDSILKLCWAFPFELNIKQDPIPLVDLYPVAYQIKGNEAYNKNQANILPLHTLDSSGGVKRSNNASLLKDVMLHIKLTAMKHRTPCKQFLTLLRTLDPWGGINRSKHLFSKSGH